MPRNPTMLSSPTTNHDATKIAIDKMQIADRTATGEAIFAALQAISTVGAVIGGGDTPPPARIILFSDGKETSPSNPDNPRGAFTAARAAHDQGIPDLDHLVRHPRRHRDRRRQPGSGARRRHHHEEESHSSPAAPRTPRPTSRASNRSTSRCRIRSATRRSGARPAPAGCASVPGCSPSPPSPRW